MEPFVVLDIVAAGLVALVALSFFRIFRISNIPAHALAAGGFLYLAIGMSAVSASLFDVSRLPDPWDGIRLAAHTSAAVVLFLAYWLRGRDFRPLVALAAVSAGVFAALAVLYFVLPPFGEIPDLANVYLGSHVLQFACYLATAMVILRQAQGGLTFERLLVPAAFLAYTMSKYTWILIDLSHDLQLVPFVYGWRFLTIALLLTALWWRATPPPEVVEMR